MNRIVSAILLGLSSVPAYATPISITAAPTPEGSHADLWEGATILHISPLYGGFSGADMFGSTSSAIEPGHTIYSDGFPDVGTTFNVQFMTASPVTLGSFAAYLADDSSPGSPNPNFRAASEFILLASDGAFGANGLPIYNHVLADVTINHPYSDPANYGSSVIKIAGNVGPITSQYFAAVFPSAYNYSGPRILELDGFAPSDPSTPAVVPLPSVAGMGLVLLAPFTFSRRRCQRI